MIVKVSTEELKRRLHNKKADAERKKEIERVNYIREKTTRRIRKKQRKG